MSLIYWNSDMSIIFFFNDTATTEIYTLSLHDALPIFLGVHAAHVYDLDRACLRALEARFAFEVPDLVIKQDQPRSEEHTSELQSRQYLVCRLLLEKKKVKLSKAQQLQLAFDRILRLNV